MRSGKLDRVIRIDRFGPGTPDKYGTVTPVWTPVATLRAQIVQASTEEFIRGGAEDQTVIIFRTRWLDGVTTADRVFYRDGFFNLKEIKELGRESGLELRAVETK